MTTLQAVQNTNQVVPAVTDPETSTTVQPLAALLPSPLDALALSGDPGAELAALVVKAGQTQQNTAQAARDADEQTEVNEDNQEVAAMHAKAGDIRDAGIADGLGLVAEGGGAVAGAGWSMSSSVGRAGLDAGEGAGKLVGGGIKVGGAYASAAGANRDADAAAHKASSDQAKLAAEDMHDAKKAGTDLVSAALDFYREYTQAQSQANMAALHRA